MIRDYECDKCGKRLEFLSLTADDQPERCACGGRYATVLSAPHVITIVRGNSDYAPRERERLEKRSTAHWHRQGKAEAMDRIKTKKRTDGL